MTTDGQKEYLNGPRETESETAGGKKLGGGTSSTDFKRSGNRLP